MSKFVIIKHVKLDFLGEGWENAFAKFSQFEGNELTALAKLDEDTSPEGLDKSIDSITKLLQKHFIGGEGFTGEKLEPISKADLKELSLSIFLKVVEAMRGQVASENFATNSLPQ